MNNLYLIGMRGVGKSSVGRLLARLIKRVFFDTDDWIRVKEGLSVIDLVHSKGWTYFREVEMKAVRELTQKKDAVISTGGGILMYFDNAFQLKKTGKLIHLTASITTLEKRLQEQTERPSITGDDPIDELKALWQSRKPVYDANADLIIDTEGKTVKAIVDEIIVGCC